MHVVRNAVYYHCLSTCVKCIIIQFDQGHRPFILMGIAAHIFNYSHCLQRIRKQGEEQ